MPAYVTNRSGRGVRARPVQGGKEVEAGLGDVYPLKMSHLDKRFMQVMHAPCTHRAHTVHTPCTHRAHTMHTPYTHTHTHERPRLDLPRDQSRGGCEGQGWG